MKIAMIYYSSWQKVYFSQLADMAQSVERRLGKAEVTGSIPVISFLYDEEGLFKIHSLKGLFYIIDEKLR